jgi:hypothetical protein
MIMTVLAISIMGNNKLTRENTSLHDFNYVGAKVVHNCDYADVMGGMQA